MVKTSVIIRVGKPEMMVIKMVILGMILFDEKRRTVDSIISSPAHCWRHPGLVRHRFCTRNALPKDGYLDIWISGKGFILIPLSRSGHHLCSVCTSNGWARIAVLLSSKGFLGVPSVPTWSRSMIMMIVIVMMMVIMLKFNLVVNDDAKGTQKKASGPVPS